jgi:hypothetical protein
MGTEARRRRRLEQRVYIWPAWDKRPPKSKIDYGVRSVYMVFALMGREGAVTLKVSTGWELPEVAAELGRKPPAPLAMGLSVHRRQVKATPAFPDGCAKCEYLEDQRCCCADLGSEAADAMFDAMIREGDRGFWLGMERVYRERLRRR